MIAKPEWFGRRKYAGWGVSIKTWQGAVYLACVFSLLIIIILIPSLTTEQRLIITGVWLAFLVVDMLDVMWHLKKDERERIHEAMAERNAAYAMVIILISGVFIELLYYALNQRLWVDHFIILALIGGIIAKSVTNYQLERKH